MFLLAAELHSKALSRNDDQVLIFDYRLWPSLLLLLQCPYEAAAITIRRHSMNRISMIEVWYLGIMNCSPWYAVYGLCHRLECVNVLCHII